MASLQKAESARQSDKEKVEADAQMQLDQLKVSRM